MKRIFLTTSALVLGFGLQAQAQTQPSDFVTAVLQHFENEGYSEVEISVEGDVVFVEAVRDGQDIETAYDVATGAVLSHSSAPSDDDDDDGEDDDDDGGDDEDDDDGGDDDGDDDSDDGDEDDDDDYDDDDYDDEDDDDDDYDEDDGDDEDDEDDEGEDE